MEINKYQLGKIYKLTSEHTDKIYIGSTCKKLLCQRLAAHSSDYKLWGEGKGKNISSFELFELGSVQITLLEAYPCETKDELLAKERYWIEKYKDIIVNNRIPITNSEEKKEIKKNYYKANKEHVNETHKKYREANKEKIKECKKKYYEANKEKSLEKQKQKYICLCGVEITITHRSRHEKSIKHLKYINELPQQMPTPETSRTNII
jgi:hypothetical protein